MNMTVDCHESYRRRQLCYDLTVESCVGADDLDLSVNGHEMYAFSHIADRAIFIRITILLPCSKVNQTENTYSAIVG